MPLRLKFWTWRPSGELTLWQLLILLGLGGCGAYILTRPCNWGACPLLYEHQHLAAPNPSDSSPAALMGQKTSLGQAIEQLQSIPIWSVYYSQAQTLLGDYYDRDRILTQLLQAQDKAVQARLLVQGSPLPPEQWQKVQQLWQEAALLLGQVPSGSPFFPAARAQLRESRIYLRVAAQRLQAEQKAASAFNSGQLAAQIAQKRQNQARSPEDWQLVTSTWQTAIDRLRQVESGTTKAQPARQLLISYLSYGVKAQARQEQEAKAVKYRQKAQKLAKNAQDWQNKGQWSQAVAQWNQAVAYLQQVPPHSLSYSSTQGLMAQYLLNLHQAQQGFKSAQRLQKISLDLEQLCHQNNKICDHKITKDKIIVTLTPLYFQQVQQTALIAKAQINTQAEIDLLNHLSQLETRLQMIANECGKPLEVYNSNLGFLTRYEPAQTTP